MDVREAIGILEISFNIDCSLKEGIREVEARMVVAEAAKRALDRQDKCDRCRSCKNCVNYDPLCPISADSVICVNEESTLTDRDCKNFEAAGYCQFCGKEIEED